MPEFGDVKQVHLPEQKKLPGDETRFFKQGGESAGKSGDWISELGNAFEKSLEKLVVGAIKLPIDLADKALTGTAKGIVVGGKSILQGIGEAIKEIRSDIKDSKAAKAQFGEPRREQTSRQKDGQREAKSTPSPSPSARPGADSKNEHQNRAAESASPRERDSSQNNSPKYGPSSAMDPAQHKTWADAPSHAATSIKVQEHKEPTVRKYVEPAKDAAARTATPPDQSQTVKKEAEAPPIVRKDHATVETEQKKWEASDYKVSAEKTSVKTVDSVLQEIRAAREIPREKAKESERAPEKSAERTR
jgi:hypothetical protein